MSIVFLNGSFIEKDHAAIPITDRGFLFGEGVFTTIRVCDGKVEFLQEHLERLKKNCETLGFDCHVDPKWIFELVDLNLTDRGIWRCKIVATASGNLLLTIEKEPDHKTVYNLTLFPYPRLSPTAHIKSLSYLDRILIKKYALDNQCDDAIVATPEGFILETAFSNLFWVEKNEFFTPDPALPLLQGVMLSQVEGAFESFGYPVCRVRCKPDEISLNAHVYICNAMKHAVPVVSIKGKNFERNLILEKRISDFLELIQADKCGQKD